MSDKQIFRKEAMKSITTPDQLTDYLHVTNPSVWIVLTTIIMLLAGIFAWSTVGVLESTTEVNLSIESGIVRVVATGLKPIQITEGMIVRPDDMDEYIIEAVEKTENGWLTGIFHADLPDGFYNGVIVTDSVKPISFLLEGR